MLDVSTGFPKPQVEPSILVCPVCKTLTYSNLELRRHLISTHLSVNDENAVVMHRKRRLEYDLFSCSLCGLSATELPTVTEHVKKAHPEMTREQNKKRAILSRHIKLAPSRGISDPLSSDSDSEGHVDAPEQSSIIPVSATTTDSHEPDATLRSPTTSVQTPEALEKTVNKQQTTCILSTSPHQRPTETGHDWSKLITRSEKKFMCLLCRHFVYNGRTEVVFHTVTRHLLATEIEHDLSLHGCLTDTLKRRVGLLFTGGMRIRSGVHYKDAKRVESALFRSIELHLRHRPVEAEPHSTERPLSEAESGSTDLTSTGNSAAYLFSTGSSASAVTKPAIDMLSKQNNLYTCSGCSATFTDIASAYTHINDELRASLPEFMRARSCPWSLSYRDEWVWCVPDKADRREPQCPETTTSATHHYLPQQPGSSTASLPVATPITDARSCQDPPVDGLVPEPCQSTGCGDSTPRDRNASTTSTRRV